MAVRVADTIEPMGEGGYPVAHAKDIEGLPTKLSELKDDVGFISDDDEMSFAEIKSAWDSLFNN